MVWGAYGCSMFAYGSRGLSDGFEVELACSHGIIFPREQFRNRKLSLILSSGFPIWNSSIMADRIIS